MDPNSPEAGSNLVTISNGGSTSLSRRGDSRIASTLMKGLLREGKITFVVSLSKKMDHAHSILG